MIYTDLNLLKSETARLKRLGKTIVWTNGCFDLIHPGHIATFKRAKELGDVLVVGLNGDRSPYWSTKPGRPINDEYFRSVLLEAIRYVDCVYIFQEETPIEPIRTLLPDVLVKGGDYEAEKIVGYREVVENGGKTVTIPIVGDYSTTRIINAILGK